jgi:hypothetical protein
MCYFKYLNDVALNRIPVMAPLLGVLFYGGIFPSKIGLRAPSLERGQLRPKAGVFLYTQKKSWMLCMGSTYTGISPYVLHYGRATFFNAHKRCGFEPGTCIIARSVA